VLVEGSEGRRYAHTSHRDDGRIVVPSRRVGAGGQHGAAAEDEGLQRRGDSKGRVGTGAADLHEDLSVGEGGGGDGEFAAAEDEELQYRGDGETSQGRRAQGVHEHLPEEQLNAIAAAFGQRRRSPPREDETRHRHLER